jgi:hypothetical protein
MIIIAKNKVNIDQLATIATPKATDSHTPIAHSYLVEMTREAINRAGLEVREEEHALASGGLNYFGGFALKGSDIYSAEREIVLGLRNSNNKQFAASICVGNRMLVCDNLCFSSDIKLARKHTANILRDLPRILADAVSRVVTSWADMEARIAIYKEVEISRPRAENLVIDLADAKGLPVREIYNTIQEFRNPRHDEFKGGTMWSLYNAVTENLKGSDLSKLPNRTMVCQSILDAAAGHSRQVFSPVKNEIELDDMETLVVSGV